MKDIKAIAEEALKNAKLPKGTKAITISFAGVGKPSEEEYEELDKSVGLPLVGRKELPGVSKPEEAFAGLLQGVVDTLNDILEKVKSGKCEECEIEEED